ncbi:MAG: sugar phosphate isomerase/epimerase family protein [Actinocatenispora sp.]
MTSDSRESRHPVPVLLSTSAVYPEPTAVAFELAVKLGYDGVEVMVWTDAVSQDARALRELAEHYSVPIGAVHAPCLLMTQRVWSPDPWERLRRAAVMAQDLNAGTVILHPPFFWQKEYARAFSDGLARIAEDHHAVKFAVENMYWVKMAGRRFVPYAPDWDPTVSGFPHYTLDISHCAASGSDPLAMADRMGSGLTHLHLGDGRTAGRDEHLVPGHGDQPCAEVLRKLAADGHVQSVGVEVATRKMNRAAREAALAETLAYAREHLTIASTVDV